MRHKDKNWTLSDQVDIPGAQLAVLMDIRDELKKLNKVFECGNFLDVPHKLTRIEQVAKRMDRRAAKVFSLRDSHEPEEPAPEMVHTKVGPRPRRQGE